MGLGRLLGRISYSFYLIHTTVLLLLAPHNHGAWLLAALTLAITLMYCALSWQFLEKPILYAGAASDARRQALVDERAITS